MADLLVLQPTLREHALGLAAASAMTAGSVYLIVLDPMAGFGWVTFGMFGLGTAILASPAFVPGLWSLTLNGEGLSWRRLGLERRLTWREVEAFTTWQNRGVVRVGWRAVHGGGAARQMTGVDGTLPSLYGREPGALVALLEERRLAALAGA